MRSRKQNQQAATSDAPDDMPWIEYMALSDLKGWTGNPKEHDIAGIKALIRRVGYVDPIVLDEKTGRVVAGHGRRDSLLEMKAAGEQPPKRVRVREDGEWEMLVMRGVSFDSESDAEAYLIGVNQGTISGGWNDAALLDMLKRQPSLDGLFFDDSALKQLEKDVASMSSGNLPSHPPEDFQSVDLNVSTSYKCPGCGYEWSGQPK